MGGRFDVETKARRVKEIQAEEADPNFWTDQRRANTIQKEKSEIEKVVTGWREMDAIANDARAMIELIEEDPSDADMLAELAEMMQLLGPKVEQMETQTLLGGEGDTNNAVIMLNSGAGGTESCDWASMLMRMYIRWCEKQGFKTQIVEYSEGEEAGIKSATIMVTGHMAYGLLKAENGVHRLVRISPFDSNARRHTSFASVYVSPEVDDNIEIEVRDADIRIDVFRSGGAGGQSVNTTDSAVRITHHPSGIVVSCQNERSQLKNKQIAMKILKSRLYEKHLEEERAKLAEVEAGKMANEWGSQIRSYVLHPYKMVKDHRTGEETSNADAVLDGDLNKFIRTFLLFDKGMLEKEKTEVL